MVVTYTRNENKKIVRNHNFSSKKNRFKRKEQLCQLSRLCMYCNDHQQMRLRTSSAYGAIPCGSRIATLKQNIRLSAWKTAVYTQELVSVPRNL